MIINVTLIIRKWMSKLFFHYIIKFVTILSDIVSGPMHWTLELTFGTSNVEQERGCRIRNLRSQAFDGFFCTWCATATNSSFIIPTILWFWACYACKHFFFFFKFFSLYLFSPAINNHIFFISIPSHNNKFKFIK